MLSVPRLAARTTNREKHGRSRNRSAASITFSSPCFFADIAGIEHNFCPLAACRLILPSRHVINVLKARHFRTSSARGFFRRDALFPRRFIHHGARWSKHYQRYAARCVQRPPSLTALRCRVAFFPPFLPKRWRPLRNPEYAERYARRRVSPVAIPGVQRASVQRR